MELKEILTAYSNYYESAPLGLRLSRSQVGVEPIFDNEKIGTLWVPDIAKGRCSQGIVKYLGPDVVDLEIGDYVIFSGYNGDLVAFDDELVIIMPEDFIQARVVELPYISIEDSEFKYQEVLALIKKQIGQQVDLRNKLDSRVNEVR